MHSQQNATWINMLYQFPDHEKRFLQLFHPPWAKKRKNHIVLILLPDICKFLAVSRILQWNMGVMYESICFMLNHSCRKRFRIIYNLQGYCKNTKITSSAFLFFLQFHMVVRAGSRWERIGNDAFYVSDRSQCSCRENETSAATHRKTSRQI